MTFNQLILKNLRKNIKHYGMFLFSLLISIILYFSFSTLKYSHSINNSDSSTIIKNGATIGATIHFKNEPFSKTKCFLNYCKNRIAFHLLNNTTNYI